MTKSFVRIFTFLYNLTCFFLFCKGGGLLGLLQGTHSNTYWNGPLCRWLLTFCRDSSQFNDKCPPSHMSFVHWPSCRFFILHFWYPEKPRLETFPRDAGTSLLRQPRCPHSENLRQPALWRGCRCHRSDNIVSSVGRQPTDWRGWLTVCYWLHWFIQWCLICHCISSQQGTHWMWLGEECN